MFVNFNCVMDENGNENVSFGALLYQLDPPARETLRQLERYKRKLVKIHVKSLKYYLKKLHRHIENLYQLFFNRFSFWSRPLDNSSLIIFPIKTREDINQPKK